MAAREAIILAGGLGTRLSDTVPGIQKCMAPVNGVAFLHYIVRFLLRNGVERFIFSVGYKADQIESFIEEEFPGLNKVFVIENKPMGTGGAILKSLGSALENEVVVLNGDTFFDINLNILHKHHVQNKADCTIALKPMINFERYGTVQLNETGLVTGFREKKFMNEGLINGGIYFINKNIFRGREFPDVFSFEKEYLEKEFSGKKIHGVVFDNYFIDIGIPEDYFRAQKEMKKFA